MSMNLWFAKKMKECPRCESPTVRRTARRGFHERVVQRLAFVWPYQCLVCSIRFVGFHARYSRRYIKPHFRLAKAAVGSK
jgi:hypothetical protein